MSSGSDAQALAKLPPILVEDRRASRHKRLVIACILIVCVFVSLFVNPGFNTIYAPTEVFATYGLAIQQLVAQLTGSGSVLSGADLIKIYPDYFSILNRLGVTVMTALCGGALALAGTLYQSVFRNPIASPSMLGVSSAIQLGDVILILMLGTAAASATGQRYLICYICVAVTLAVLFAFERLVTRRGESMNIINLLLIATVITQLIGVIVTYISTYLFDQVTWEVYNGMTESLTVNVEPMAWAVTLGTFVVALIPIWLTRFRLNSLNFSDADMKLLGVNGGRLRILALVCGTVLLMGAQVEMGTVAMLSLVVPHLSRMIFGAEFRKQFWGNIMLGGALLVFCRIVVGFIPLISTFLPISTVLNFIILPFFVWMIATQQRGWQD